MTKKNILTILCAAVLAAVAPANADDIYRLRLFFGLSIPGGGAVSLAEWRDFRDNDLAKTFAGFNVADTTGYYQGKPERSKVVTLIVEEGDIPKAKAMAARYAKRFGQESVMLVKIPVEEWRFVGAED